MNHIEATQHIKATLAAFGPSEAINLTQDTWAKLHEAMSVLIEQPAQQRPLELETVYETIIQWDEGGGKRSRRELARRIVALYTSPQPAQQERCHLCDCTGDIHSPDGEWRGECPYCKQPAQRTWVGLTDVEWMNIVNKNQAWFGIQPDEVAHEVCKLTEAKLREKNGGAA